MTVNDNGNTLLGSALARFISDRSQTVRPSNKKRKNQKRKEIPQLLLTINNLFKVAVKMNNDVIMIHLIKRWIQGVEELRTGDMDDDMINNLVKTSLLAKSYPPLPKGNDKVELSRLMIEFLLTLPNDMIPLLWEGCMEDSTGSDLDFFLDVVSYTSKIDRPVNIIEQYIITLRPVFTNHQTRVINDFEHLLSQGISRIDQVPVAGGMLRMAHQRKHFDLFLKVVQHLDWVEDENHHVTCTGLLSSSRPVTLGSFKAIFHLTKSCLNKIVRRGDINFLQHIKHLLPDIMSDFAAHPQSYQYPLFDEYLLNDALGAGHYECAVFIMDNIIMQYQPPNIDNNGDDDDDARPLWFVGYSIDLSNHKHDWLTLIDRLLNNERVSANLFDIYSSAIRARHMDVIKRVEQANDNRLPTSYGLSMGPLLNVAIREQYIEGIKSIIQYIVEMILAAVPPGILQFRVKHRTLCKLSASTVNLMIKYGHNQHYSEVLAYNAALLGQLDLFKTLCPPQNNHMVTHWISHVCKHGQDHEGMASMIKHLFEIAPPQYSIRKLVLQSLINFSQGHKVDALLATPNHTSRNEPLERRPAKPGMLESLGDVLSFFNMRPEPRHLRGHSLGHSNHRIYHDVSALSREEIEFIWSRVNDIAKECQFFINDVLSSQAAVNNIITYQVVLDSLIEGGHFQTSQPFIRAPSPGLIRARASTNRRYASSLSILKLFNPQCPESRQYSQLLIPLTEDEIKQHQSMFIDLGVFEPLPSPSTSPSPINIVVSWLASLFRLR
ncbi:hypothetical protein SAMD00019534_080550 [Acytostelium subglobosum LB1]|uniref:hypothetical protein n=1 Tax=Acytostelium subglobosum LB1 TaxID=1410327 RepID=UPI0006448969|nr:hypothetical protein SAMD00019534_080550 [Acytostelium subglobosum LB1]GAM24880.1 hypothetical protein SAMD00019534_080550 [Acytostelium subglobosum LB1]|eukprot:XP_012751969.1 hypothetical protein SAMD00019534_080550 [Acytostelium subglobosum LB1]